MSLEIWMFEKNSSEKELAKKTKLSKIESVADNQVKDNVNENDIDSIREKLEDPGYIDDAVNRLATIITNKILILRGEL